MAQKTYFPLFKKIKFSNILGVQRVACGKQSMGDKTFAGLTVIVEM
jgi:hypothetical protein